MGSMPGLPGLANVRAKGGSSKKTPDVPKAASAAGVGQKGSGSSGGRAAKAKGSVAPGVLKPSEAPVRRGAGASAADPELQRRALRLQIMWFFCLLLQLHVCKGCSWRSRSFSSSRSGV